MTTNPYLHYKGQCEEAFKFYEKCLGGKVTVKMTYRGSPMEDHVSEDYKDKMLHARMTIGDTVLMGSDTSPERYTEPKGFFVALGVDKPEEAERAFKALSENATIDMPLQETFWAQRFGLLTDQFGVPWSIDCEKKA